MSYPKDRGGMGFCDLQLFNDAMLAKLSWRLLESLNSLCARVLKGRYYPEGDVFLMLTTQIVHPQPGGKLSKEVKF
jgi:hypothetical protein